MKSSSARCGNSTSPRTRSWTSTTPSSGVRKRRARPSPRGSPEIAAVPVVARRRVPGRRPLPRPLVDLLARARAGVQRAAVPQGLDRRRVCRLLRRLEVGALVGGHAEPVQGVDDAVRPQGPVARLVGVLDPQDEGPPVLAHEEPVEERGPRAPDVEVAGRRRGEARPGRGGRIGHAVGGRTPGAGGMQGEGPGVSLPLWRWPPSGSRSPPRAGARGTPRAGSR